MPEKLTLSMRNRRMIVSLPDEQCAELFEELVLAIFRFAPGSNSLLEEPIDLKGINCGITCADRLESLLRANCEDSSCEAPSEVHLPDYPPYASVSVGSQQDEVPIHNDVSPSLLIRPKSTAKGIPSRSFSGHKGFLYVRCPDCGAERGLCTKTPITEFTCRKCGNRHTLPERLSLVDFRCKCGSLYRYLTNITSHAFDIACFKCGAPNTVFFNGKTGNYDDGSKRIRKG